MCRLTTVPILLLFMARSLAVASTQDSRAAVAGRVTDTDGAGLPGVVVLLLDASLLEASLLGTTQARAAQAVTDIEGNYRISAVPAGSGYLIKVAYPGFAALEVGPLELAAGRTTVADLTLRTDAESTEVVRVEASGHTVDTDNPETATRLNREMIEGLPIIGHDYRDFLALASGVTDTDGDGNPNVHGSRETGVQYRLDGGNITDPVSGTAGQNLNPDIIEEIEFITAGASAEYGDADGGFANIITKSGGNDFEGRFSIFWRGRLLDGQGPGVNDVNHYQQTLPEYRDLRPSLSLGGAIAKDKLWYFGSVQLLDTEEPVQRIGVSALRTSRGVYSFGKLTWQVDPLNKLTFQVSADPRSYLGNNLGVGVSPDSDYELIEGALIPQLKWTATLSPRLLLEAQLTRLDSGAAIAPVSDLFEPLATQMISSSSRGGAPRALYPCPVINCDPSRARTGLYQIDRMTSQVTGPFYLGFDARTIRTSLKTDISLTVEDAWGQHVIRSGFEVADETYRDEPTANPVLFDYTTPLGGIAADGRGGATTGQEVAGYQSLVVFQPLRAPRSAARLSSALYVEDSWKPAPHVTVAAGVRLSHEDIDTLGFTSFDPREERRRAISLWDAVCAEAAAQGLGGACIGRLAGSPPLFPNRALASFRDGDADGVNDVDPRVEALDVNGDGRIETAGSESEAMFADFTTTADRHPEGIGISNTNLSPRLRVAWDPWTDGRTRFFGTWSRIPDRLFLDTMAGELGPERTSFLFFPDASHRILPGAVSLAATAPTIGQVDRDLRTPFKEELTLFERELAPEWSLGLTMVRARYRDQLQDVDINHLTCPQHGDVLGIEPYQVCGDGGMLEIDRFGSVDAGSVTAGGSRASLPNGAPDLYVLNDRFNQVLRLGNFNSTEYSSYELSIIKRLHRNWQMRVGYTWSEVFGQAESYDSPLGDDPETTDDEQAYLDHDQRHVLEFQSVTRLPHGISLGTVIQWASGTPYSVIAPVGDLDSAGNANDRAFYPTGERNDQRNEGTWRIDARIEKAFTLGRASASGFLNVENVLDSDDLTIAGYSSLPAGGALDAERRFRRFEIGATVSF